MYTLVTELLGVITREFDEISLFQNDFFRNYNWLIYNLYMLVFTAYMLLVYYRAIPDEKIRKFLLGGMVLTGITAVINAFYQPFPYQIQSATYLVGAGFLVTGAILYLRYRSKASKVRFDGRDFLSWMSLGIATFYTGFSLINIMRYLEVSSEIISTEYTRNAMNFLIFFLYGCIIVGFIRMGYARRYLNTD